MTKILRLEKIKIKMDGNLGKMSKKILLQIMLIGDCGKLDRKGASNAFLAVFYWPFLGKFDKIIAFYPTM